MRLRPADKLTVYAHAAANALGIVGRRTHPPAIIWVLTQRCFYACVHCDSWQDTRSVDESALERIAQQIADVPTKIVALSGGEPFMVKGLRDIVARLKHAGKIVAINTNGHLLERHAGWLVGEGVDHVQVSVDAHTAPLHDAIRRHPGSFDAIVRGIEALTSLRGGGPPRVSICAVLMPENAAHVVDLVDRFAGVADAVEMQPLHDSPGLLAVSSTTGFAAGDRALVERQMAALAARHPAFATDYYDGFARFLFDRASMQHAAVDHCLPMIFSTLTIREDGEYRICRYPLHANAASTSIVDVWNSPRRWQLYRELARSGCGEPCWIRCHNHPSPRPGRALRGVLARVGGAR